MFVVAFVLSLCRAAARGDRAIVRRRMLGCHHRWLDETPEGRRLGTDKDYCVFCHKSRSELMRSNPSQPWEPEYNNADALDAANRRR
jgi:hypothetical protein